MNNFVIILGEPNSINSEILAKSKAYKSNAIIIGNYQLLKSQLKILKINRKLKKYGSKSNNLSETLNYILNRNK